jgi:hypothetical protein
MAEADGLNPTRSHPRHVTNAHPAKHRRVPRTHLWDRSLPKLHQASSPTRAALRFPEPLERPGGARPTASQKARFACTARAVRGPYDSRLAPAYPVSPQHPPWRPVWDLLWRFGGVLRGQDNRHLLYGPGHADSAASLPDSAPILDLFSYPHHHLVIIGGVGPGDRPEVPPPQAASGAQPHPLAGVRYQGRLPTKEHQRPHAPSHRTACA